MKKPTHYWMTIQSGPHKGLKLYEVSSEELEVEMVSDAKQQQRDACEWELRRRGWITDPLTTPLTEVVKTVYPEPDNVIQFNQ